MKMYRDAPCSIRNEHRSTWGMKTLKMCFGKDRLKPHETIEQGNNIIQFVLLITILHYGLSCVK